MISHEQSIGARAAAEEARARSALFDLSKKDLAKYSLTRACLAAAGGSVARAGFENEISQAITERTGELPPQHGFHVPTDVLLARGLYTRDMTAAGVSGSNYLVSTDQATFSDLLRARSVAVRLGAEFATNLVGNVSIPRITADSTTYWLANETTAATESQPTIGQVSLSPKHVAAYTEMSRLLNLQSPAADAVLFTSLARAIAVAVDRAALRGSGASGEPVGIMTAAGTGAFTGTSLGWAALCNAEEDVIGGREVDISKCGWTFTSSTATLLMARERVAGSGVIWEGAHSDGLVAGCRAIATNSLATGTGIFGAWDHLAIGEWGRLTIEVNPYANFANGVLGVRGIYAVDIGIRDASAFSVATSIT